MTITQQPDALSLSGNLKKLIFSGVSAPLSFSLSVGGGVILTQQYSPDADGQVIIDIKDVVESHLSLTFSDVQVAYQQSGVVRDFSYSVNAGAPVTFRVIRAGIDSFADTAANFLAANFLTWQPQIKHVTYYTPENLTYYAAVAALVKLKLYYADGDPVTVTLDTLTSGKCWTIPVTYARILSASGSEVLPGAYDIWIENGSGNRLTYIQRYLADSLPAEDESWVIFENSLGGFDTFRATGTDDLTGTHTHNLAEVDGISEDYRVDTERVHKKSSGYLDMKQRVWLLDFFPSRRKWVYISSAMRSIVLTEDEVTYTVNNMPSEFSFSYKYADAKPYLNIARVQVLPTQLQIVTPDLLSFSLPPRLVEFAHQTITEGALLPVQNPYSDIWGAVTFGSIVDYVASRLGMPSGGGVSAWSPNSLLSVDANGQVGSLQEVAHSNLLLASNIGSGPSYKNIDTILGLNAEGYVRRSAAGVYSTDLNLTASDYVSIGTSKFVATESGLNLIGSDGSSRSLCVFGGIFSGGIADLGEFGGSGYNDILPYPNEIGNAVTYLEANGSTLYYHLGSFSLSTHNHNSIYSLLGHNHDDRYCTETEINSILGNYALQSALTTHATLTTTAHGLGASAFHADNYFALAGHNHSGVYQPLDADLTAIAGLTGTSGFLKKTAANTWSLDTNVYLTTHQTIYALTIQVNGATIDVYTPNSSSKTINISDVASASALSSLDAATDACFGALAGEVLALQSKNQYDELYAEYINARAISSELLVGELLGNAATATKLKNARTLWGCSFDGTANVSGNMTGVGSLDASGDIRTSERIYGAKGIFSGGIADLGEFGGSGYNDILPYPNEIGNAVTYLEANGSTLYYHLGSFSLSTHNHNSIYSLLGHNHDDRYCTETEINSILGNYALQSALTTHATLTTTAHGLGASAFHADNYFALAGHNHSGVYQPLDADLTAIAGLTGTSGFLKKTAANTWSLDTNVYLTTHQTIYALTIQVNGATIDVYTPNSSSKTINISDVASASALSSLDAATDACFGALAGEVLALQSKNQYDELYAEYINARAISSELLVGELLGNAATATKLKNARTLWGCSFDGTANVSGNMTGVGSLDASGDIRTSERIYGAKGIFSGGIADLGEFGGSGYNYILPYPNESGNAVTYLEANGSTLYYHLGSFSLSTHNHNSVYSVLGHTHDDRYYTETEIGSILGGSTSITGYNKSNWDTAYGWGNHASVGYASQSALTTHANLTTTAHGLGASAFHADNYFALAGHNHSGVYQPLDADLTAIAGLTGTSGFLKKTAANTWSLDTNVYLTTHQTIYALTIQKNGATIDVYTPNSSSKTINISDVASASALSSLDAATDACIGALAGEVLALQSKNQYDELYAEYANIRTLSSDLFIGYLKGNADTATKLSTGRTLKVNLFSTSASTAFNGTANIADIGVSGILPVANGGTGLNALTSGYALIGNGTGVVNLRAITNSTTLGYIIYDTNLMTTNTLAFWNGAYNSSGTSNISKLGTITAGVWHGTTLEVAYGGIGKTDVAANSMLYASSANTYAEIATSSFGRGLLNSASGTVISGLNADTVDGLHVHSGMNYEANKVVRTDGNGYLYTGWINTISGGFTYTPISSISRIYCSEDAFIRYLSPADFKTAMQLVTLNETQTITGAKTFSASVSMLNSLSVANNITAAGIIQGVGGVFAGGIADLDDEEWTTATLSNGTQGTTYGEVRYRKIGGNAQIDGSFVYTWNGSDTPLIFTLPTSCCPIHNMTGWLYNNSNGIWRYVVGTDGKVTLIVIKSIVDGSNITSATTCIFNNMIFPIN